MPYLTPPTLPTKKMCRRLLIPDDVEFIGIVSGALLVLADPASWEKFGAITPEQAAQAATEMIYAYWESSCMIGAIFAYGTENPPDNCLICDGSQHLRVDYPDLYSKINPILIVDADNFITPDLRDKFILAQGTATAVGDTGGESVVTLTVTEIPLHSHTNAPHSHSDLGHIHAEIAAIPALADLGTGIPVPSAIPSPSSTAISFANIQPAGIVIDGTGGEQPHNNMPPFYILSYCILAK